MTTIGWALGAGLVASLPAAAQAQDVNPVQEQLEALQHELQTQRGLIEAQTRRLEEQQREIERLRGEMIGSGALDMERGSGLGVPRPNFGFGPQPSPPTPRSTYEPFPSAELAQAGQNPAPAGPGAVLPQQPVGEDPNLPKVEQTVAAVPEGMGVLTRPGKLVFEPSIEYSNSARNRLVFRGIEITPGIQIGVIEASEVDRNTFVGGGSLRYGLFRNVEVEARVPYLFRSDMYQFAQLRDGTVVRELQQSDNNLGDIEFAVRYQINRPLRQSPIFVANLRVKSDTGKGPFEIPFDTFGIATGLATGSGFWAVQPGINMLLPSDPAVIFGGVSYLYHMPKNINKVIGDVRVGRVDPGDAINANVGFGFALNPRFSFSLAYRHSYIFPTESELGTSIQRSSRLHVGALSFGMSYRFSERRSVNFSVDLGTTADAPNLGLSLRVPFSLN